MFVIKRSGLSERVAFDKITKRIRKLAGNLDVNPELVAQKTLADICDGITTSKLDEISADISANMSTVHPDYDTLASRIYVSNMQKNLGNPTEDFVVPDRDYLFSYFGLKTMERVYLKKGETPQAMFLRVARGIHGDQDLENVKRTYDLLSLKKAIHATPTMVNAGTEFPQMSSCFLTSIGDSMEEIYGTLQDCALISKHGGGIGIHAQSIRSKGSAIKSTGGKSDGIIPMLRVFNATARYANQAGVRKGSFAIYMEPWHPDIFEFLDLKLNQGDEESRCRDLFLALWVPDAFMRALEMDDNWALFDPDECPDLYTKHSKEFEDAYFGYLKAGKARRIVKASLIWSAVLKSQIETGVPYIMYKDTCNERSNQKNLGTLRGSNLCVAPETLVLTKNGNIPIVQLENQNVDVWNGEEWSPVIVRKTSDASELVRIETDTGTYLECTGYHKMILKDETEIPASELKVGDTLINLDDGPFPKVNSITWSGRTSPTYCFTEPKKHRGVFNGILTSQCTEILEYTSDDEIAVCNLASISLPSCVSGNQFDFEQLLEISKQLTLNLNRVIDRNYYPVPKARNSNLKHRPIGIGIQGLADVFQMLDIPFGSEESRILNAMIFETMYYGALSESMRLAKLEGPYESFAGSPASEGILQFDYSGIGPTMYDWETLKRDICKYGLCNSLLLAPMPTATTSQVLGNNECFEPYTTNMYLRRTLAGEFVIINRHLVKKLQELGVWNSETKDRIIGDGGSVTNLDIPDGVKEVFKTAWEISPRIIMDMARDRGYFIDQSQSMNLFVEDPTYGKLSSIHMYGWKQGLKTGSYYIRTRPKAKPIQVTLEPATVCSWESGCLACGS
jgi:ribonucleotide reductase alpha subunit